MRVGSVFRLRLSVLVLGYLCSLLALPLQASLDDPTRPPLGHQVNVNSGVKKNTSGPRWVLNSTLVSPQRRSAVINDRVVTKGDRVDGAVVIEIQPNRVRLNANGREITLVMLSKTIKRPVRP
jgi:hypothetical protein